MTFNVEKKRRYLESICEKKQTASQQR